jgi:hypothetical protein
MSKALEGSQTASRRRNFRLRPIVITPDFALSLRLLDATSDRPGGYVGQAASPDGSSIGG